jgi:hypothetical protein
LFAARAGCTLKGNVIFPGYGQQPHDQKINIWVWGHITVPGSVGESGHRNEDYERSVFMANYYADLDVIEYEDCSPDVQHWRWGHCS